MLQNRAVYLSCTSKYPKMTSSIPNPLPVTSFPSLTTLFDAPDASSRPSSYREERAVRCRALPESDCSATPEIIARRYASFLLALTGEDEVAFTLHHIGDDDEIDDISASPRVVYATKQDGHDGAHDSPTSRRCTAAIINQPEEYTTTDFALVLGKAPSEALKVWRRSIDIYDLVEGPALTTFEAFHSNPVPRLTHDQLCPQNSPGLLRRSLDRPSPAVTIIVCPS